MKYLCVTTRKDHHKYTGSGKIWKKHLAENGRSWTTELIFSTDNIEEFSKVCIEKSVELDVVRSPDWANCRIERGGGEYPVDSDGKRILTSVPLKFDSEDALLEFCKNSKWFECSICGARMTEGAFLGRNHSKCKAKEFFKMIPIKYQ